MGKDKDYTRFATEQKPPAKKVFIGKEDRDKLRASRPLRAESVKEYEAEGLLPNRKPRLLLQQDMLTGLYYRSGHKVCPAVLSEPCNSEHCQKSARHSRSCQRKDTQTAE